MSCLLCLDEQRWLIDEAIRAGATNREVACGFGVSKDTVARHKAHRGLIAVTQPIPRPGNPRRDQRRPDPLPTWTEALAAFSDHLEATHRVDTKATILRHLGWLAESVQVGPWELTSGDLAKWLDGRNWSRETRRKVLVSFRQFWAWGVSQALCEWAPTAGLSASQPLSPGPKRTLMPSAWREPWSAYVAAMRSTNRSEGTLTVRGRYVRLLGEVAADPWSVTTSQLEQWISNPDWASETKRAARASARSFYRWAVRDGRIEASPAYWLDPILTPKPLPAPIPIDALREGLSRADDRTRLILLLAVLGGLRCAEIAGLHTSHFSDVDILVLGKGGKQRRVPLHPTIVTELRAELERRRRGTHGTGWGDLYTTETGYLFPSAGHPGPLTPHHVGKLATRVLPRPWTLHKLRHRYASAAYSLERDLLAVSRLLGHSRPETTARYAAVPEGALTRAVAAMQL